MFNFNTNKHQAMPSQATANGATQNNLQSTSGATQPIAQDEKINARIAELEAQRREFMLKHPDFDINAELDNDTFANYVFINGLTLEDAYFLVHRDEIIDTSVKEALDRISLRRNRITENGIGKSSPVSVKKNPKDMSDKEIDLIIERVKNGEKISF